MTQRIFDMENEQDVKDLFDILPDNAIKIIKLKYADTGLMYSTSTNSTAGIMDGINIKWNRNTSIHRPVDKSKWIGCLCWLWDGDNNKKSIGILESIDNESQCPYMNRCCAAWKNCRPVKREEIKFVEDMEA